MAHHCTAVPERWVGASAEGVDGEAEAAGRTGGRREGVAEGAVIGGAQQPLAVAGAEHVDPEGRPERLDKLPSPQYAEWISKSRVSVRVPTPSFMPRRLCDRIHDFLLPGVFQRP